MVAPQPPAAVQVAGGGPGALPFTNLTTEVAVRSTRLGVRAKLGNETQTRRLVLWIGRSFAPGKYKAVYGKWITGTNNSWQTLLASTTLPQETEYKIAVFVENRVRTKVKPTTKNPKPYPWERSSGISGSVWMNRAPAATVTLPPQNFQFDSDDPLTIDWTFTDPDAGDKQTGYQIRYRVAAYGDAAPGPVTSITVATPQASPATVHVIPGGTFTGFTYYEYQVLVCDGVAWSPATDWRVFYPLSDVFTPLPLSPIGNSSINDSGDVRLSWKFRSEIVGANQTDANIRYRAAGTEDWNTVSNTGADPFYDVPEGTLLPGVNYEWQVQTVDDALNISGWSISAFFWMAPAAGINDDPIPDASVDLTQLGCGQYRAFIYDRGGQIQRGEITPIRTLQWDRRRDDISQAILHTNGFDEDCGQLLKTVHCWQHELVIFRDGERVWEGPITRITESDDGVELDARDPMVYVYRRIMRMGYNDSYHKTLNPDLESVVFRAYRIVQDALGYDDPNVLQYLTPIQFPDDAREGRNVPGWSKSAWEEIDDLAANAGLDYTTVGRRIILWDVHRALGELPEMRNGDFSDPVKVTEYGMSAANVFAVSSNTGFYGVDQTFVTDPGPTGHIEQIASAYGESDTDAVTNPTTVEQKQSLINTLTNQAERNLGNRWPIPVVVRVPDNTTVLPHVGVGINQLVPGVWIPLRSVGVLREISQIQKLDNLKVTYTAADQEKIMVTMSPTPSQFTDTEPDVFPDE
jgi:hypothetical protein